MADVFKWVDEKGGVHFTDDQTQVPEKYRSSAEKRDVFKEDAPAKTEAAPPVKKEQEYKDRMGRSEDYWRGRAEEWRNRMKAAQEKVEVLRAKYNALTEKYNESKSSSERATIRTEREKIKSDIEEHRARIEESKRMLEKKIPEEAELYRAKPEWVKQ